MLIGAAGKIAMDRNILLQNLPADKRNQCSWVGQNSTVAATVPWQIQTLDAMQRSAGDEYSGSWLVYSGYLFSVNGKADQDYDKLDADSLLRLLTKLGLKALGEVDGNFAIAWYEAPVRKLHLIRDRFGIEPLYYGLFGNDLVFGSRIVDLPKTAAIRSKICMQGLLEFLTYCYIPGNNTLDSNIYRVPAGSVVTVNTENSLIQAKQWYSVSFENPFNASEHEICNQYSKLLEIAVKRRLDGDIPGVLLSGGMDSSSVLSFVRRNWSGPIRTFAFRCAGQSFDESVYARAVAEELRTEHREIRYDQDDAFTIEEAVPKMSVPFCDIGIEIGTWLLGREATNKISYVLTGDGGDELWGSHPVYAAQRLMKWYDKMNIPLPIHRSFLKMASLFHDSDRKRDLRVIIKRLLPSDQIPASMGPFRWRIYYGLKELKDLLTPGVYSRLSSLDPFKCITEVYEDYKGPDDGLSPHLFNDYKTASSFYFSRLQLLRNFGIESRCPFYDRSLVEFGARIPANLKLEGIERTKRLFRKAMRGIVPDIITNRKDKLGHSVPLKNWLRNDGPLSKHIDDVLSRENLKTVGLFNPGTVRRMIDEHRRMRHNHSHRIWAMYVLMIWLREREIGL